MLCTSLYHNNDATAATTHAIYLCARPCSAGNAFIQLNINITLTYTYGCVNITLFTLPPPRFDWFFGISKTWKRFIISTYLLVNETAIYM